MTNLANPDEIIEELGGCGRFQIMINVVSHLMKIVTCWSVMSIIVFSYAPPWRCSDDVTMNNMTSCVANQNGTKAVTCPEQSCMFNETKCSSFEFDERIHTLVTEFNLVCEQDYIPSMIMSLQVVGVLVGNIVSGHVAEYIGRKKPFFFSVVIFIGANLAGYFTVDWIMFAVVRIFIGMAYAFFMTTTYSLLCEFSLAKWRVWIIGFPSWPMEACLFALVSWLMQDWRYIQLLIAIIGIFCLLPWFIIPESFRWYIAHGKLDQAKQIIRKVAAYNKREIHNIETLMAAQSAPEKQGRKYTLLDLFRTKHLIRITIFSAMNWFALDIVTYGIAFGIQSLSGNLYLNLFLFSLVVIPSKVIALWLQNRIGRRNTTILCFALVAIGGIAVGVIEGMHIPNKGTMINVSALVAMIGSGTAWGPVQTMTIENYPTVIRPIAFGTLSNVGTIGAMIGPQLAYLNLRMPGTMYYVLGAVGVCCMIGCLGIPETKNASLADKIKKRSDTVSPRGSAQLETLMENL